MSTEPLDEERFQLLKERIGQEQHTDRAELLAECIWPKDRLNEALELGHQLVVQAEEDMGLAQEYTNKLVTMLEEERGRKG